MLATPIARLRTIGLIESLSSFALFFIAMPIKWIPFLMRVWDGVPVEDAKKGLIELPVTIVGSIHGGLFCIYILVLVLAARATGMPKPLVGLSLLAAILPFPFGLLVLDPRLKTHEEQRPSNQA
ncbi:MAG: DUF3817 domain-containing protein [Phycisphaeraceae bacterium]|nr:DUF3817 domain-containing protein [Phycisphaeraceae bacterium]